MSELLFRTATDAASSLRRKEVSSRELTELLLERIEAIDPTIGAVAELRREEAVRDADAADRALSAEHHDPLLGLPMTIKEGFNVSGLHTTWGNPLFKDYVADWDATVVRRLRHAGAVIVGKSNVQFMLADFGQTTNELYGTTSNPWDASRTPGGSSGGAAAAVSAGASFLEFGSDLAGSIRIPASFCGVYGLRPTPGTVPLTGFQPPGPPQPQSELSYMAALGPLARSVPDLRCALNATAGPESPAARAYRWTLAPPRHNRLDHYRVGAVLDHEFAPVSAGVGAALSAAIDAIARAGATIVTGWPADVDPVAEYESFGFHLGLFLGLLEPSPAPRSLDQLAEQERRRLAARAVWSAYFDEVDVFLCPSNFTAAFPHDSRPFSEREVGGVPYDRQPFWTAHAALAGLPSVVAPVGKTREGLPVGMQIVGGRHEDDTPLAFAELLAEVVGGYEIPPI